MIDSIKFDWISFTLPKRYGETTLPEVIHELFGISFDGFVQIEKKRNYYRRSFRLTGPNGDKLIEVFVDADTEFNRNTTLFQVSGFALSAYAGNPLHIDVPELFRRLLAAGGKPTVLHICMDDTTGRLPWDTILRYSDREHWKEHIVSPSRRKPNDMNRETVYFGQRSDRNMVTIYQKHVLEETKFPWVRVEYRTKDRDTAKAIAEEIAAGREIGPLAAGLIRRFLDFKEQSRLTKYNRPSCQWWVDFLGGVEKMIISRDLAPKRNPAKQRKPRTLQTITKDLDKLTENDLHGLIGYLADKGLLDLADATGTEPKEQEPPVNMPPPVRQFDLTNWAPEIVF